ncbi:flagellar protein FlgN [Cohnella lubricantis]|uniref:Flagellar protein FlgN n=1 Tax=Cohnella lubricantis TaxID=2163172 RepID=A0A841T7W8_9BACL|nr:flagellar protein FlgN [Cohnella lubricantis]MBB6677414.1 flagellar protein FlgN [Cohnella lubricantis]MBP2118695.1 hypothetical protein [Cohnella lubricantis]
MTVNRIIETLRSQAGLYEQLLAAEREKTEALIHNKVDQLNAIVQKERKLAKQAEELEQLRIEETQGFFAAQGLHGFVGQMSDLARAVHNPDDKGAILSLQDRLSELLGELKRTNEQNQLLTRQALDFIRFSVDLMVENPNEGLVYEHPMNQSNKRYGSGLFDSRI